MVDLNNVYQGNWLKAQHLQGKSHKVIIESTSTSEFTDNKGNKKTQIVLHFAGKNLPLGLNITNALAIAQMFGSTDSDDWVGKQIVIYPTTTQVGLETKPCIRVMGAAQDAAMPKPRIPVPQLKPVQQESENPADFDDEIEF